MTSAAAFVAARIISVGYSVAYLKSPAALCANLIVPVLN
jgi:hypothetical protein